MNLHYVIINLFYSILDGIKGKKYLKAFVLQSYVPTECIEQVRYVLFLRGT